MPLNRLDPRHHLQVLFILGAISGCGARPCEGGTYETSEGACEPVSLCTDGEYESAAPNATRDRQCAALTPCTGSEYESAAPTATSDRSCAAVTACTSAEYESAAPTATSDRSCNDLTVCTSDQYQTTAPTATTDRACTALTACTSDQYQTTAPTATTDRACTTLTACTGDQYQTTAPTATTDRACTALTACTSDQYQTTAPTATTDRVCDTVTLCAIDQFETAPPTATSDRECADMIGTTTYSLKVDGTPVCTSTYATTGVEYTNGFCDNCDFMFSVEATETANSDTTGCPNRDPWRYTLATPYPAAYPDDRAGIGYVAEEWYYSGYGYLPFTQLFFTFYHTDATVYGYWLLSGVVDEGTADEWTLPGTFTNTDGDIAWTYDPDSTFSPRGALVRNCTDRDDPADGNYLGGLVGGPPGQANIEPNRTNEDTADPDDVYMDYVTAATATLTGSLTCSPAEYADSFTVDVAAAATLSLSLDIADSTTGFDPYIWVNDAAGCTVAAADDQYNCTGGECDDVADTETEPYGCCSSLTMTNGGSSTGTYTVYVTNSNVDACLDGGNVGNYSIEIMGGTNLTPVGQDLHPSYELDASGTVTLPSP